MVGVSNSKDLFIKIIKFNKDGNDEEIIRFNNVRFLLGNISGFIMTPYFYQFDLQMYKDNLCYFVIEDHDIESFGFINIDSIKTYYEKVMKYLYQIFARIMY